MQAPEALKQWRALGVSIELDGDELVFTDPRHAMSEADWKAASQLKPAMVAALKLEKQPPTTKASAPAGRPRVRTVPAPSPAALDGGITQARSRSRQTHRRTSSSETRPAGTVTRSSAVPPAIEPEDEAPSPVGDPEPAGEPRRRRWWERLMGYDDEEPV